MRCGAYLPTCWDDYGTTSMPIAIEEVARAAETLGYEGVWANDLVVLPATGGWQDIEPLVTLASLVHLVPRLTLGIAVMVLPQRNTMIVAKQAAALDILSQHRLILGVGIGHRPEEFGLLGADYASRGAMADEQIEVLRTLWRGPAARYAGQFHRFDAANIAPHPPEGGPPIWIGGDTKASVKRAASYGDGWLPFDWKLEAFRDGVTMLRELTGADRCPTVGNVFYLRIQRPTEPTHVMSTTPWMPTPFGGDPDAVAGHIDGYREAGLEYALVAFESEDLDDSLRQMRLFAEEVMPRFAAAT